MSLKPWQPQVVHDQLLEVGTSKSDVDATKFNYLEFRDAGRVRNVTVFADLLTKLRAAQGVECCSFHLVSGQHVQRGDVATVLVAVGRPNEPTFGIDMKARGSQDTVAHIEKARKMGKLMHWGGIAMIIIGIPLIPVFVGILIIGGGVILRRTGKNMVRGMQYQLDMLEQCSATLKRIPGVRLV
ncbi:hypothetical protein AVMA1855_22900 [Acidovorax sp. SUPP1855]|uniref:hypothetical protein n=1 Tax=Acidovorax sp. SUPP1855 TaxID=431774 RepID=UPI0023DE4DC3|nr:hypothetical protein [Acidovorax sp. SUPP1855]GKS87054.1 hypothetical protein AVMA1855_22900 [Acidovorax sp. SUPP1855]